MNQINQTFFNNTFQYFTMNTVIIILVTLMIISSISATSAQTTITVTPTTLNKSGDKVHVTWAHIPNPTTQDWLGIYSPATSPDTNFIGYFFLNSSSTWHTGGGGSLTFPLINLRGPYHFRIFRQPASSAGNRLPVAGTILVESGEVGFARPNGPEQVHLGFTERADEMRVVFVAGDGGERVVKYGEVEEEEEEGGGLTFESQTRVERYEVDDMCDSPANTSVGWRDPGFIFDGVMTNLKKGTRYYYKVGSDSGGWSRTYNFVSRNEDSDETIAFLFGDMGTATPYETFTRTQAESTSTVKWILRDIEALGEKPAFISHIGDISYAKGYAWLWDNFFNQIEPLASRVAYHVCMGNHEYDWPQQPWKPDWASYNKDGGGECGVPYSIRFKMPGNSSLPTGTRAPATRNLYYSFNMGSVHFVYFSTEINFLRGSDQYDFLKRDLENVNRTMTPFVVVQGHRPMYTTSNNVWDAPIRERMMSHLEPLFVENKVTLALWGHVHRYERFCPLNNFTCGETQDSFPVHAVIGMAGRDWQSIWEPRPEHPDMPVFIQPKRSLYRGGEFGYTRLVATKQKLTLSYVGNHDGQVHDRVEILATGEALSGGDDMFATIFNAKITDKMKIKGSRSLYVSQFMKGAILLVFGAIVGYLIGFFISRPKNETGVSGNSWIPMKTEDAEIELQNDDKTSLCK